MTDGICGVGGADRQAACGSAQLKPAAPTKTMLVELVLMFAGGSTPAAQETCARRPLHLQLLPILFDAATSRSGPLPVVRDLAETDAIASQWFARLGPLIVQHAGQPASSFPKSRFRAESLP